MKWLIFIGLVGTPLKLLRYGKLLIMKMVALEFLPLAQLLFHNHPAFCLRIFYAMDSRQK